MNFTKPGHSGKGEPKQPPAEGTHVLSSSRAKAASEPINILIVDDDPKNLTVLETVLDDPSYRLIRASSADQALLALVAEEFALLILDISMPDMSGLELAQMIKDRRKTAHVPIIFLTAYFNEDQHVLDGYGVGAVDYLHKPVNPAILRSKVAVFVELHRKNRSLLVEMERRQRVEAELRETNAMLEKRVLDRTEQLAQNQSRLCQAADAARLTYFEIEFEKNRVSAGPNFAVVMGFGLLKGKDDLPSAMHTLLGHVIEEDRSRVESAVQQLLRGTPTHKIQYRILGDDWIERWIESDWSVESGSDGAPTRAFGTNLDITLHKRTEAELRRANLDLEQFAYSASHDLQEPIRGIAVFCQLLHQYYGPSIDDKAKTYFEFINEGTQRMSIMLADLLKYSQTLAMNDTSFDAVDVESILKQVLADLHLAVVETNAAITYDALPLVQVKPVHLQQLLQNLIENGLKYRKEDSLPRIHIAAMRAQHLWQLSVTDNGIGIAPEFQDQVFRLFKRLHPRDGKYPGTGIGLAICQKIVERYGGRIWIESKENEGATFHFTLPAPLDTR
jgi:signal transduction histidine kinase